MTISHVRKRSGNVVPFDKERIFRAVMKASEATDPRLADTVFSQSIVDKVVADIHAASEASNEVPMVEHIQDTVEKHLVASGNYSVAKNYILYRAEHERIRAEERLHKIEENLLKVKKEDGSTEVFDIRKVRRVVNHVASQFPKVDSEMILKNLQKNIYDGISSKEVSRAVVMVSKSYIEKHPQYSYFAAALLLQSTYRETFQSKFNSENFEDLYKSSFKKNLQRGVDADRINPELMTYDFGKLTAAMDFSRDKLLNYLGMQTLYDRYFIHVNDVKIEAPQQFWMRVAMGLALAEKPAERNDRAIEFYNVLSTLRFVNSTPTLFNAGTTHSQLSSCYLSTVTDSLDHIFKVVGDNAQLSKWAGGIGNDWTNIRATGARIHGTNGKSQGVIPFLKIANDTAVAVNQGGKRKGAVVAYLESWHYDVEEFLELRRNTGDERRRTHDMNTANWIPDLFMKRLAEDGNWTLFSPNEVPGLHDTFGKEFNALYEKYEKMAADGKLGVHKTIKAADLWRKMVTMLFETGHPWITFKDACNVRSPQDHVGVVHNSNLCTEITLNNSEDETAVCNLGSINMRMHCDPDTGAILWDKLQESVKTGMRMLDNVIDINFYPTAETKNSNMKHRPVGLGIMGLQDVFFMQELPFDSNEAVKASDNIMEFVSYHSIMTSSELAKDKGSYLSYPGSKWSKGIFPVDTIDLLEQERGVEIPHDRDEALDWTPVREHVKLHGMRNSNCMAIAPTATISNISGCTPCIEPIYKNLYVKSNMGGEFTVINTYLVEKFEKMGLWNDAMLQKMKVTDGSIQNYAEVDDKTKAVYKEVFEVNAKWFIRHAAARGKWIDQAQSVNIFYKGVSGREIAEIYKYAWEMGLKTTYYLRTLGASQVEKSTVSDSGANTQNRDFKKKSDEAVMCSILNGPECEACQ